MEHKLSQILIKNKDHFAHKTYRKLSQRYTKLPHIYGLPKIHKDGIPLRPIVSCHVFVCHSLSSFLVDIIDPLIGKSPSYARNLSHFVEIIKNAPILSNQMVSPDVVSLFTKVPTEEALSVARGRLASDSSLEERTCIPVDNLIEILTFCTQTTYIYRQDEGLAMGSPLSLAMMNIYMECSEEMILEFISLKPTIWLSRWHLHTLATPGRCSDSSRPCELNKPSILFTMEKESNNALPFLNVLKSWTEQGFKTSVYRKPTFPGQYLNFNSTIYTA